MAVKADPRAKRVVKYHEKLVGARQNWDDHWQNVAHFVIPELDGVWTWKTKTKGEEKHQKLYDNSAEHDNELLSAALMSMAVSPTSQWFELTSGNPQIDKIPRVRKYFQDVVMRGLNILNSTNFHTEIGSMFKMLGPMGTGPLNMVEDDDFVVIFKALPVYQAYFSENAQGLVTTKSEEKLMTVYQAYAEYGREVFGDLTTQLDKDVDKEIEILHLIMERKEAILRGFIEDTKVNKRRKKKMGTDKNLVSLHIYKKKPIFLRQSGYDEYPGAVPRWAKTPGEIYGRGPGMKALPEIRMINQMRKVTIRSAQKTVDPPLLAPDDGIMGRINSRPGGITTYRSGTADRVEPLNTGGDPGLGREMINDSKDSISRYFFIDQLQLRDGPQMTATEVNERVEQSLRLLGPILTRLEFELLQPIIARLIRIMLDRGMMPAEVPEELAGVTPRARFSSQIAKALRAMNARSVENFMSSVLPLAEIDPSVYDHIDTENYIQLQADNYSVPQEIITDPEKVKKIQEARAAQAADAQRRQQELEDAEKVSKVGPVVQNAQN